MKLFKKALEYLLVIALFVLLSNLLGINYSFMDGLKGEGLKVEYGIISPLSPVIYENSESTVNVTIKSYRPFSGIIRAEFTGISANYEESFSVWGKKDFKIKPLLKEGSLEILKRPRDVQFKIEILDKSGNVILAKSENLRFLSRYDMVWSTTNGVDYSNYIAAWITPENPEIKKLLRKSLDYIKRYPVSDNKKIQKKYNISAITGYQFPEEVKKDDYVYAQLAAVFDALKEGYSVRYVSDFETGRNDNTQAIKLPSEVLNDKSGLCIETVVTMASAVEAAGMNPVIILSENHSILGVEIYPGAKTYIFWETTDLNSSSSKAYKDGTSFFESHKNNKDFMIIDIKKAREKGIKPLE